MTIEFSKIENINLPSNMYFGKGSEPTDITEFTFGTLRWSLFYCAGSGWFTIKQEKEYDEWYEIWTHQGDSFIDEKTFAEKDIIKEIINMDSIKEFIIKTKAKV